MFRLLRADFARLIKNRVFWICAACTFSVSMINIIVEYLSYSHDLNRLQVFLMKDAASVMIFSSVFSAMYIGTDCAYGTMRNKIIAGRSRAAIYSSNLIVTCAAALFMRVLSWAGELIFGYAVGGRISELALKNGLALSMTAMVFTLFSACSVFTLIGMFSSSKAVTAMLCIMITGISVVGGSLLDEFLIVNEMNPDIKNKAMLKTLNEIHPGGQAVLFELDKADHPLSFIMYSLGVIALITAIGIMLFQRKDLK